MTIPTDLLLEPGRPERLDAVRAFLEAAGLPPDGLDARDAGLGRRPGAGTTAGPPARDG